MVAISEYHIAPSVLEDIVTWSLNGKKGMKIHSPLPLTRPNPIDITLSGESCAVTLHLDAQMGKFLPGLATEARTTVATALRDMAGLHVTSVDVIFASVFSTES